MARLVIGWVRFPRTGPTRGSARCLASECGELAGKISAGAFERDLLVETAGQQGEAVSCCRR